MTRLSVKPSVPETSQPESPISTEAGLGLVQIGNKAVGFPSKLYFTISLKTNLYLFISAGRYYIGFVKNVNNSELTVRAASGSSVMNPVVMINGPPACSR